MTLALLCQFTAQHVSDVNTSIIAAQYSLHDNAPNSRKLLKMDVLTSKTCWAVNWHNKAIVIKLVYLYSNTSFLFHQILDMYISIDTGCPVAESRFASPAITSMYLTLFLNLQMETSPIHRMHHHLILANFLYLSLHSTNATANTKQLNNNENLLLIHSYFIRH